MIIEGHTNSFHGYTLDEALTGIAAAGYEWAELTAVPDWADFVRPDTDVDQLRAQLERHGLQSVSMSAHLDVWSAESWDYVAALVEWSGGFGLKWLNVALADKPEEARQVDVRERLAALESEAGEAGVTLCVETHGKPWRNGAAITEFLREMGSTGIGINYDTGNVEYYGGGTAVDDLPAVLEQVQHVHLKDHLGGEGEWAFPALGGGHVDFEEIFRILSASERQLHASVELEFFGAPYPSLPIITDAMKVSREHAERFLGAEVDK